MKNKTMCLWGMFAGGSLGLLQILIRHYDLVSSSSVLYGQLGDFAWPVAFLSLSGLLKGVSIGKSRLDIEFCLTSMFLLVFFEFIGSDPKWFEDCVAYSAGTIIGLLIYHSK